MNRDISDSDGTLAKRIADGCSEAAGVYWLKHQDRLASRVPSHIRDDVIQSSGRRLIDAADKSKVETTSAAGLSAYVSEVVRRRELEESRVQKRWAALLTGKSVPQAEPKNPVPDVPSTPTTQLLSRGKSQQQAADALGVSTSTVNRQVSKLRILLARRSSI